MAFSIGTLMGYLQIDGVPQAITGIRSVQESMDITASAARQTGAAVDETSAALVGAGRQSDVAAAGSGRLRAAQLSLVAAQERYNTVLADSDASVGRLASAQASLIRANDRVTASTPITPAAISSVDTMASKIRGLVADTAKMALGFAVIGGVFEIGKAIQQANEFQRSMLQIQTQAGASATEVKTMTSAVLGLSGEVATSPEQLATSLYHVESLGLRAGTALNIVKVAAEGAKVGNADLEETTNALTATVASGIPGVQNMTQAMGALNAIVGSGDMKLSDLNEALGGGVLTVVKGYGLSLRDVGAALATFGDNNIRGANAATMLRMAVQSMAAPMKTGQTALESLGLQADTLRTDMQTGGLDKAILDLNAHLTQAGDTGAKVGGILTEAFGKRAGPGLAVLIGQVDRLQSKYGALTQGAESFGSAWDATTNTASFGFDKLKASAESAGISIFEKVGPVLGEVASDVGVVLPAALHLLESAVSPLSGVFSVFAGVLKDSGGAAKAIADVLHDLEPILGVIGPMVIGVWAGFKAGELVVATVTGVQSAVETLALKVMYAKDSVLAFGSSFSVASEDAAVSSAAIAGSAESASATVVASGEEAAVGWGGLAGPIGAAVVGIGVLVTMFHKSSDASKEATDAAKAYSDALASGSTSNLTDSIVTQLANNKVPEALAAVNKGLGSAAISGKQFVDAIQSGGPAMATLKASLNKILDNTDVTGWTLQAIAARKLLGDLNTQANTLTKEVAKDLTDTAAFAGVSSSIDKVSEATVVGSATATTYANMMGIVVDQNGVAAVSADVLDKAVSTVADAYNTATTAGSTFLGSLDTFSKSAGTASDRAALIGSTLVAANGDALTFASSMNGAATASATLISDVAANAKSAGQSLSDYMSSIVDLKTGTIDYSNAAAAPLITDLQGIQTAATGAATATYQHELATKGAGIAADDAYSIYVSKTQGSLIDQAKQLGLNATQVKTFADQYFGIADAANIKKTIEMEGADPVVTVLNQIGTQLAHLTGVPWVPTVTVNVDDSQLIALKTQLANIGGENVVTDLKVSGRIINGVGLKAAGGEINGPGTGTSDTAGLFALSNKEWVVPAVAAQKYKPFLQAITRGDTPPVGADMGSMQPPSPAHAAGGFGASVYAPVTVNPAPSMDEAALGLAVSRQLIARIA